MPYEIYKKEITLWQTLTYFDKAKQGVSIYLSLHGKAEEACIVLKVEELNSNNGVEKIR